MFNEVLAAARIALERFEELRLHDGDLGEEASPRVDIHDHRTLSIGWCTDNVRTQALVDIVEWQEAGLAVEDEIKAVCSRLRKAAQEAL